MEKLQRIVTVGISGGRSLTGPLRDARRFPSTRWNTIPEATHYNVGVCPSFKGHFLSRRANLSVTTRDFCIAVCVASVHPHALATTQHHRLLD